MFSMIILILVTLVLVIYEFVGIYAARKKGLTKNVSRMITHLLMLVLLIALFAQIIYFGVKVVAVK